MTFDGPYSATSRGPYSPANMPSSASTSEASSLSSIPRRASAAFPKSHIEISIDNHFKSQVYTSGSPISGHVTIVTQRDVCFDEIQIILLGTSRSRVDGMHSAADIGSTHTFLKLSMPVAESTYPVPRVLETGQTYTIPFNFVIPPFLTIGACNHHASPELQEQHLRLPPTMGAWERDDMSPEMARIEYNIKARVVRDVSVGKGCVRIFECSTQINVLPSTLEDPPLNITKHDRLYTMTHTKKLKKTLLSGKLGYLTATAEQPPAAVLRSDGLGISESVANVNLSFEPTSADVGAPRITNVSAKLTASTYFSSTPIGAFPNLGDWTRSLDRRGAYDTSVSLFSKAISSFSWAQESTQQRRDSGYGSDTPGSGSDQQTPKLPLKSRRSSSSKTSSAAPVVYKSVLQVPLKLPLNKKTFIPTFHSCIASRTYAVQLAITFAPASSSAATTSSTIHLRVPLQVVVEPTEALLAGPGEALPSFESAVEEAEADAFMRPRVMSVPDTQFMGTSHLPGYADISRAHAAAVAAQ